MQVKKMGKRTGDEERLRFPAKRKLPPSGPDALMLDLPAKGKAETTLSLIMRGSSDSRDLSIIFSNKEGNQTQFDHGLEKKTKDGEPVSYYLPQFGVYGMGQKYELEAPKGKKLMLERNDDGDLTVWIKGQDLSKAKKEVDPKRYYVTKYVDGEKIVGYTIKDFLRMVNLAFYNVRFQIQA
ncbi:hypothetical protein GF412_02070 [Candidatus Micrarchaeota archaeon]|nr:hypothetical protein [Candidatus Micrarchaeota archaeon]MBD3417748.1 hypothetical protein [Candidatus Micrarchaeota archaeon]